MELKDRVRVAMFLSVSHSVMHMNHTQVFYPGGPAARHCSDPMAHTDPQVFLVSEEVRATCFPAEHVPAGSQ